MWMKRLLKYSLLIIISMNYLSQCCCACNTDIFGYIIPGLLTFNEKPWNEYTLSSQAEFWFYWGPHKKIRKHFLGNESTINSTENIKL